VVTDVISAYILIQTEVGRSSAVGQAVAAIQGVTESVVVTGPYDVIARTEAADMDELGRLSASKIQAVEGVTRTLTCPVVHL
jgi:DNA-binding Lrp family transcriptional regulator